MRQVFIAISLLIFTSTATAQDLSIKEWIDAYVKMCVGSGSTSIVSGELDANAGISLKKLGPSGAISGQLKIYKKDISLLSDGLNSAMNEAAAGQADKVRECLAPLRETFLEVMRAGMLPGKANVTAENTFILNPDEVKIVKFAATNTGAAGKIGQQIDTAVVHKESDIRELRFNLAIRSLESKFLITMIPYSFIDDQRKVRTINTLSLTDKGEEYAVKKGYSD